MIKKEDEQLKKRFLAVFTAVILVLSAINVFAAEKTDNTVSAAWIATVYGLDFPKTKTETEQKAEFRSLLDGLKANGINTVVVQVRPKADALYKSDINPWSDVLTGIQGADPGYDPMAFMIEETHARGMKFHAWLNPYRVTTSGTDLNALSADHPARLNPDWVIEWNNALYYDPANSEVKQHICDTVEEIINNYDVDGIHFDDYFYPNGYPLSEGENKDGAEAQARRTNVNDLIYMVSRVIKNSSKNVVFGVSPSGICVNEETGKYGSVIKGNESYYTVYADPRVWIDKGWIDYIVPQVYWEIGHKTADFETVVKWWQDQVKGTDVDLYIGHGIYKDVVASEITSQLKTLEKYSYVKGSFFYSAKDIINNRKGCGDAIKAYFYTENKPETTTEPEKPQDVVYFETEAVCSKAPVRIDGEKVTFEAYNIGGYTYFKLRDIAMALSGTAAKFDVGWDSGNRIINIIMGVSYLPMGGELSQGAGVNKKAVISDAKISLNGDIITPMAYNIDGNNYYKLRDLGESIGFDVQWDEQSGTIIIYTE